MTAENVNFTDKEKEIVQEVQYWGRVMGEDLKFLLAKHNSRLEDVVKSGAICFDVFYGYEIRALGRFKPNILVVTEPYSTPFTSFTPTLPIDKERIIRHIGEDLNIQVHMEEMYSALEKIKESKTPKVGLVTWLNISPDYLKEEERGMENVRYYLKEAKELTTDSGVIIFTVREPWWGKYFQNVAKEGVEGLEIDTFKVDEDHTITGSHCLIARKTS